jgi:alpha-galactosidase
MSIEYDEAAAVFHLKTKTTSYVIGLQGGKHVASVYWGSRLRQWRDALCRFAGEHAFDAKPDPALAPVSLDSLPREYPAFGNSDFRSPAFQVLQMDGSTIVDAAYRGYRISPGKIGLAGLPSTYAEPGDNVETLTIELRDDLIGLEILLMYSVFPAYDAITRSVLFRNCGDRPFKLLSALSASVDLPRSDFEMLHLSGDWGRERSIYRRPLAPGIQSVSSRRGASSHQHNPFIALLEPGTDEDRGEVFAMNLVYSGNFLAQAEVDQKGGTRLSIGINPFEFSWLLEPGEDFQCPEAVLVHSCKGLGGMSACFHPLYRERLCRGAYRDGRRPILINNWEATYFDFDADKIAALGEEAGKLGIELLVLDDGWFGHRDNDRSSLGDWVVDRRKLPLGLGSLASRLAKSGLRFGLWFEPEMVSPDSDLYRAHPDWCIHVSGRPRTEGRNQLVLDMGRAEVRRYVIDAVSAITSLSPDFICEVGHESSYHRGRLRRFAARTPKGDTASLHPGRVRGDG